MSKADAAREYFGLTVDEIGDAEVLELVDGSLWEAFYDLNAAWAEFGKAAVAVLPEWFRRRPS